MAPTGYSHYIYSGGFCIFVLNLKNCEDTFLMQVMLNGMCKNCENILLTYLCRFKLHKAVVLKTGIGTTGGTLSGTHQIIKINFHDVT